MKKYLIITFFCLVLILPTYGLEQHLLLIGTLSEGNQTVVLEILSTGKIIDTGQRLNSGYGGGWPGVSPDQQEILIPAGYQISQYHISATGIVSTVTTYPFRAAYEIGYHPNGKMVIASATTIFHVNDNGILVDATTYNRGAANLWINPEGNIMASSETGSNIGVFRIDTTAFSINTAQLIFINGSAQEAVYTPDGSQLLIVEYSNEAYRDVDIFQVTQDGVVVDTTVQHLDITNTTGAKSITMTASGHYAFVMTDITHGVIATIERTSTGQWIDTGKRVSNLNNPWLIRVTPAYNLLVLQTFNDSASERLLQTYFVNSDGSLTPTGYSFSITAVVGDDDFVTFVFAYPPGVTEVKSSNWQLYQ
jgi:hypothetical protein